MDSMIASVDIIIGIDPDVDKNGVAVLDIETRKIEVVSMDIVQTTAYITELHKVCEEEGKEIVVCVEAGWSSGSVNWHKTKYDNLYTFGKKCYSVGENHRAGKDLIKFVRATGVQVAEHAPLRKCWKGKDRKITHEELVAITGLDAKRTNQEERDAALLAWAYAGLPIIITPKKRK